ncbi:hypothetical protein BDF14DRAFT_515676 [Spinellus fusiger]|nr:hypothetical protein BDF14DRAFT_515676 [Spinellus fusiger]
MKQMFPPIEVATLCLPRASGGLGILNPYVQHFSRLHSIESALNSLPLLSIFLVECPAKWTVWCALYTHFFPLSFRPSNPIFYPTFFSL